MTDAPKREKEAHDLADLLMKQYQALKQDMVFQMGSYKNHVRNNQIIGAAIAAAGSALISSGNFEITDANKYLWLLGVFFIATVSFYMIHDVFESVFAVKALEQYLAYLEDKINEITGCRALLWQSYVASQLWPLSKSIKDIKPPVHSLEFYQILLILCMTIFFPAWTYYKIIRVAQMDIRLAALLLALGIFLIMSIFRTLRVWRDTNFKLHSKVKTIIDQAIAGEHL